MHRTSETKRVVFTIWGSFGDIHPFMGLALEMKARGHRTAIATESLIKRMTEPWVRPIRELRAELGLPAGGHPLFEGQHSPRRVLALFSSVLAPMQPDYPAHTIITGFPFYDRNNVEAPTRELMQFLDSGEPPILFRYPASPLVPAIHAAGQL